VAEAGRFDAITAIWECSNESHERCKIIFLRLLEQCLSQMSCQVTDIQLEIVVSAAYSVFFYNVTSFSMHQCDQSHA
jgi:hypothetical protein